MVDKLFEGGNVFKNTDGQSLTQRISKDQVVPTVQWLEQLTGLNLVDNMLGSTGRAESSGDLDLGVDATKITKEVLAQHLRARGIPPTDLRQTGDILHLKTPILGNPKNGYVQTDFMFSEDPAWQHFSALGGAEGSQYKGKHRHILLSSIAKAQDLKWSPKFGLINRTSNQVISRDPNQIASTLLGQGRTAADLATVDTIIKAIKNRPDFDQLVAGAKEAFSQENLALPESSLKEANWFRNWSSIL